MTPATSFLLIRDQLVRTSNCDRWMQNNCRLGVAVLVTTFRESIFDRETLIFPHSSSTPSPCGSPSRALTTFPFRRMLEGHSAVVWQASIYIWGGKEDPATIASGATEFFGGRAQQQAASPVYYSNKIYCLNPLECMSQSSTTLEIVRLGSAGAGAGGLAGAANAGAIAPRGRAYHCASMYGKLMFVTGGLTDDSDGQGEASNQTIPAFDFERRVWLTKSTFGDVPCPRCHHVAVVYGDTLMLHGGYPLVTDRRKEMSAEDMSQMQHAMYDVHELNLPTMRWRRIQVAQSPSLWGHSAVTFNRNVIVFGGVDVHENAESGAVAVWHADKKLWRWADFSDLELRCAMHTAVVEGGRMYVFGGVSFRTQSKLRSFYQFNLESGAWREVQAKGSPPLGRIGHAAVALNSSILIIGGSVEDLSQADGATHSPGRNALGQGCSERVVHVYNVTLNEWKTCAIIQNTGRKPTEASGEGTELQHNAMRHLMQQSANDRKAWRANNRPDATVDATSLAEWEQTSQQVSNSLSQARGIQSLADAALQQVGFLSQQPESQGSPPRIGTQRVNVGAGGSGGPRMEVMSGSAAATASRQEEYPWSANTTGDARDAGQMDPASADDSRRAIDQLKRENELLRAQIEDFRSSAVSGGDPRNPFEVPMFNTSAASAVIPPDEHQRYAPVLQAGGVSGTAIAAMSESLVPRLNLNVAEPPRALGGTSTGYMSRSAVSALVASSLGRSATASATLAGRSSLLHAGAPAASASLDPMSYLTGPSASATAAAGSGALPMGYDFLLARQVPHTSASLGGSHEAPGSSALPLVLQPLLSLFAPQGQQLSSGGVGSAPPRQQQQPQQAQYVSPQQGSFVSPGYPSNGYASGMQQPANSPRAGRTPSLAAITSKQASMLSL